MLQLFVIWKMAFFVLLSQINLKEISFSFQSTYGIFLDEVSAVLTMNQCFEAKLPSLAAQVAYEMMLQEENFAESPLLAHMSLFVCLRHLFIMQEKGWPGPEPVEEPDEASI